MRMIRNQTNKRANTVPFPYPLFLSTSGR